MSLNTYRLTFRYTYSSLFNNYCPPKAPIQACLIYRQKHSIVQQKSQNVSTVSLSLPIKADNEKMQEIKQCSNELDSSFQNTKEAFKVCI